MANMFKTKVKPTPRQVAVDKDIQEREDAADARTEQLRAQADKKLKAKRGRRSGRRSLISGTELGVIGGQEESIGA